MQAQPQHVDGRAQQQRIDAVEEARDGAVRRHHVPMAVDRQRRIGLVSGQHQIDRLARGIERRVGERPLRKHRRKTRGDQQNVALAQRNIELLGKMQDHVAGRLGAARLEKAQVLGRDLGLAGEIELAHAPALAPFAPMIADRPGQPHAHESTGTRERSPLPRR